MFFHRINSSQIGCRVAGFDGIDTSGLVEVFIGNAVAVLSGEEFIFRNDSSYMTVSPQNVIPV